MCRFRPLTAFSFCTLTRLKTIYQTSLNVSCACGTSGLSPGEKKREIISCTSWRSGIQCLLPTSTAVLLVLQEDTESCLHSDHSCLKKCTLDLLTFLFIPFNLGAEMLTHYEHILFPTPVSPGLSQIRPLLYMKFRIFCLNVFRCEALPPPRPGLADGHKNHSLSFRYTSERSTQVDMWRRMFLLFIYGNEIN